MKNIIMMFLAIVILVFNFANAQAADALGPKCKAHTKILPVKGFPQDPDHGSWCWVATAQTVMFFHNKQKTEQCELVEKADPNLKSCCGNGARANCNRVGWPEDVFDTNEFSYWPLDRNGELTWTTATDEICQGRPFISSIDLEGGEHHSIVVIGYTDDPRKGTPSLRVFDPAGVDPNPHIFWIPSTNFFNLDPQKGDTHVRDTYQIKPK